MKKIVLLLPELIILILSCLWLIDNYRVSSIINYYALSVAIAMVLQLVFKFKIVGLSMAIIIALFSLYMVLAVVSEFNDFPQVNFEALKLLVVGIYFCFLGFIAATIMAYKYVIKSVDKHYFSFI
jgi:hypothetical protein